MFSFPFLSSSEWSVSLFQIIDYANFAVLLLTRFWMIVECVDQRRSIPCVDCCTICVPISAHPLCCIHGSSVFNQGEQVCRMPCHIPRVVGTCSVDNVATSSTSAPSLWRMQIMLLRCPRPRVHLLDTFSSKCALSLLARQTEASSSTRYD